MPLQFPSMLLRQSLERMSPIDASIVLLLTSFVRVYLTYIIS